MWDPPLWGPWGGVPSREGEESGGPFAMEVKGLLRRNKETCQTT